MINNTIANLKKARNDIRDAIINKGGSLTPTSRFDTYADAIRGIQGKVDIKFPNSFLYLLKEGDPDLYPYSSSSYRYRGTQTKVYLDDSITDVRRMFGNTMVDCVVLPNGHTVTNMGYMFSNSQATALDLSNFDTSNVTNMYNMFNASQATTLDLSSFDTSKVTNMGYMFERSQATTLDLSSFDTSKVTSMYDMFSGSQVKIVYCRTEDDRTKFMSSTNLPAGINFIVGKP